MLAARAGRIAVSPTMKVTAEAIRLKAQGVDVIDFGAGEPDFPTPRHVSDAAKAAIDANFTKYTTNSGTDDLKRAVAARYRDTTASIIRRPRSSSRPAASRRSTTPSWCSSARATR